MSLERFDPVQTLRHIERRIGGAGRKAPKRLITQFMRKRPLWLENQDEISRIYLEMGNTVQRGEVRWAAVVHANELVYVPGPHTSAAQVVYDASGRASLQDVIDAANRCFETKHGDRNNEAEVKIGRMLADEMERALDWPLPSSLAGDAEMFTSIAMLPRDNTPYRILALTYFPVLADPESRLVALVPGVFWDEAFTNAWKRAAIKTLIILDLNEKAKSAPPA